MANRIADQMGGLILVEISGEKPEKLMNLLMSRGVFIQDVKKKEHGIILKIRTSALEATRAIAEEQGLEFRILYRSGAPVVKKKLKRRVGLWVGILLVVALLYLSSSFIWFIDVEGNEKISQESILQAARSCGFYVGVFQSKVNRLEVEEGLLRNIPELAYAEIHISGVKANIKVVERVMASEDIQGPCDIVARCDGVVEEILLQEGQALVQKGDAVTQGQVLISGVIMPPEEEETEEEEAEEETENLQEENTVEEIVEPEPILVRARGVIKARVWYESYGECPIWREERTLSGREETSIQLCLPWGNWTLRGDGENPYVEGKETEEHHVLGTPWGDIGWKEKIWREEVVTKTECTREEALEMAKVQAKETLMQEQGWQELPAESHIQYRTVSQASDVVIRVRVTVEQVEDIAQAQRLPEES